MGRAEVLRLLNYILTDAKNVDDALQNVRRLMEAKEPPATIMVAEPIDSIPLEMRKRAE